MPEHVLVERSGGAWSLSGLVDFEPSMTGLAEYDFCAVGIFLTRGHRDLFRDFLLGYGYADADLTDQLSRRIMALLLLHRYGNVKRFLERLPSNERPATLEQLARYWYGA
jgi:hygromycin-B 7''-O-kinase